MKILDAEGVRALIAEIRKRLSLKQDAEQGKGLSEENYTTADKEKLEGIDLGEYVKNTDYAGGNTPGVSIISGSSASGYGVFVTTDHIVALVTPSDDDIQNEDASKKAVTLNKIPVMMKNYGISSKTTIPEMQNIMRELVNSGQKNLVDLSRLSDRTFSGFELKNNGDGSLTLNGSRTSTSNMVLILNINAGIYSEGDQFQLQCLKEEGEYVLDTTSFPLKLGFQIYGSDDGKTLTSLHSSDGGKLSRFTLDRMYKFIWFRLLVYGNSVFDNVTVFPAVYKAELYDLDQSFQTYAMNNAELTEQISDLSDRIKTLEQQLLTSKIGSDEMMEERSDERTEDLEQTN